jgi:hypothetical protein
VECQYVPSGGGGTPLVEHFNGQAWSLSSVPLGSFTGGFLYGTTALAANNVWAVGSGSGTGGTLVEHWDGATWSLITSPNHGTDPSELRSIAAVAPDDLWAVGTNSFNNNRNNAQLKEQWNGTSWTIVTGPDSGLVDVVLTGVAASSANNVWILGSGHDPNTNTNPSLIEHWNGSVWTATIFGPISGQVAEVEGITANSSGVWVVGTVRDTSLNYNVPLVEHWDGVSWSIIPSAPAGSIGSGFTSIAIGPYGDIWAAGFTDLSNGFAATHGLIERLSIGGFAIIRDGPGIPQYGVLYAISMVAPGSGFAVGDTGTTNANHDALAEQYFALLPAVSSQVPHMTAGPSFACHV